MKRHPALRPLSDDHHDGLVLARRARRAAEHGDEAALAAAWAEVRRRFAAELAPHFGVEEAALLPALEDAGESPLVARIHADHARLRALAGGAASRDALRDFAAALHDHVRFEERELFPRAEAVLAPGALAAVETAARDARARRSAG